MSTLLMLIATPRVDPRSIDVALSAQLDPAFWLVAMRVADLGGGGRRDRAARCAAGRGGGAGVAAALGEQPELLQRLGDVAGELTSATTAHIATTTSSLATAITMRSRMSMTECKDTCRLARRHDLRQSQFSVRNEIHFSM